MKQKTGSGGTVKAERERSYAMPVHEKFKFDNLNKMFRGMLPALFDDEMRRCLLDCKDRFEDDKARSVKIEFRTSPRHGTNGDEVDVEVEVVSTVPKKRTRLHTLAVKANGEAMFHPDLLDEPEGRTLYDEDTGEVKE